LLDVLLANPKRSVFLTRFVWAWYFHATKVPPPAHFVTAWERLVCGKTTVISG